MTDRILSFAATLGLVVAASCSFEARAWSVGGSCTSAVVPADLGFAASGGNGEVEVQGTVGCAWTAATADGWIQLVRASGVAGETISFTVQPLPSGVASRSGVILVDGLACTVLQTIQGPELTEALRLFGDVTFNSKDLSRQYSTVAAGDRFTLAVTDNAGATIPDVGRVVGFGRSNFNQCVFPSGNDELSKVSAGTSHALALTDGPGDLGFVRAWGDASGGKCAVPADLGLCRAISAGGTFSMALTEAGTVRCWGYNSAGQCTVPSMPPGFVIAIAAGNSHAMALVSQSPDAPVDAVVHVWGSDQYRQVSREPKGLTGVVEIAAGGDHCVARLGNGQVVCWGRGLEGQCTVPEGLTARQIDARGNWTLAVSGPSAVRTWGNAPSGFSADQQAFLNSVGIREARAGADHIAVLAEATRTLVFSGSNDYFQQNGSLLIDRVAGIACGRFSFAAWNDIGQLQVFCTADGPGTYGLCNVPDSLERVHQVALGGRHAVAIERNTRRVVCWGDNSKLQCDLPVGIQPSLQVAAGSDHSASIANDAQGTLSCWGLNGDGQATVPALVGRPVRVACGRIHTLAIVQTSTPNSVASVRAWGKWGLDGQVGQPVTVPSSLIAQPIGSPTQPTEVAGGDLHCMALLLNGTVVSWGIPGSGQQPTPPTIGACRAIAAGSLHSVAVLRSDRAAGWGRDEVNQVSGPESLAQVPAIAAGDNRTLVYVNTALPLSVDIDGDGCTNGADLGLLLTAWGTDGLISGTDPQQNADLNGDGVVNGADLGLLLEDWYANPACGG
ncbi:MAG: hypothetical protein RLZZ217_1797 [Planctomycetota bacterium]